MDYFRAFPIQRTRPPWKPFPGRLHPAPFGELPDPHVHGLPGDSAERRPARTWRWDESEIFINVGHLHVNLGNLYVYIYIHINIYIYTYIYILHTWVIIGGRDLMEILMAYEQSHPPIIAVPNYA